MYPGFYPQRPIEAIELPSESYLAPLFSYIALLMSSKARRQLPEALFHSLPPLPCPQPHPAAPALRAPALSSAVGAAAASRTLSSHSLPSCLLRTSKGLSWLSVSSWWKPPSSHYCLMCAKRPAHKQPAGGPNFHFPHAAQRDSIENKQGKRALGGVRQRVFAARHH